MTTAPDSTPAPDGATAPTSATRLTVVNALLLPMADAAPGTPDCFLGWMTVGADGRITGLGPGDPPPSDPTVPDGPELRGEVLDAGGAMIAPGFVSAHSHLFTSGMRGLSHSETLYPWVRSNAELLLGGGAEDMYWFTLHGSIDFLNNGITSAYNFTHSRVSWLYDAAAGHNEPARINGTDYVTRQFDGAVDAGLRVVHSFRLDDEAFTETQTLDTFAELVRASEEHTPADQLLGTSIMGSVQWSSAPRTAQLEAQMMREHGVSNQAHFVETAEGIAFQQSKFGWYDDAGALGPDFLFGHFVHPTDAMVERAAAAGCPMVWQPTSNGRLGSGIADVVRFRELGMPIGMGLDDQSCTDISDPFQNMRIGMYTTRAVHSDASVMTPREVLRMHTLGSAEVLGVADRVGSLEVGKMADFLVVDHRRPDTGPVWDVVATYVMACGLRNLRHVYVGGERVSTDGVAASPLAREVDAELLDRTVAAARQQGMRFAEVPGAKAAARVTSAVG